MHLQNCIYNIPSFPIHRTCSGSVRVFGINLTELFGSVRFGKKGVRSFTNAEQSQWSHHDPPPGSPHPVVEDDGRDVDALPEAGQQLALADAEGAVTDIS